MLQQHDNGGASADPQLVLFGSPPPPPPPTSLRRRRPSSPKPAAPQRRPPAAAPEPAQRVADRARVRHLLMSHGYEHAVPTAVTAIAAELSGGDDAASDDRMHAHAARCEALVLDVLAIYLRRNGWAPGR